MSKDRMIMGLCYIVAVLSAHFLKKITNRIANKAIEEKNLRTGIFTLYPVEGQRAVELAKGYIRGAKIYFWFVTLIFPFIFILLLINGAI